MSVIDPTLLILLAVIIVFGLIMLSSASAILSYKNNQGDSYYYLKHQIIFGVLIGGLAFYIMSKIDYHYWRRHAFWIVVGTIILLLAVFIPGLGSEFLGAKRWIDIGGFVFQPSEVVKLSFLIYLSAWLEKKGKEVADLHYGLISFLVMLGFLVLFIAVAQKDLGTTMVIAVISVVVYFIAGAPWKHLGLLMLGGVVSFLGLVKIAAHRVDRLTTFFNPQADLQGIGYHVYQALIAIGSGGFFGVGLGHSMQKKLSYLPAVMTDSIFAVIAEELGFLFSIFLVILFFGLVWRILLIAKKAPDQFGRLLAVGIATWIGFQAFVNIGAMLALLPLTGIPLPFISYGSSSMIMLLAAMGLVANISKKI
ncbi:MAG: cell division protein FtsW [Candidatus Kerfeldbacteria bacterium RIFOXYA2_FULL_38_24]|uniref:Probable peptidoglycan glycosyltransferase FtsW n=1 Tax=Candidatus Kerfeldbacteria bacterium RIFOXYB2_FULL_38_14 TaxID=1798547 RepID=A0A1G2BGU1_9BACT|nr:MAG: cell division protein FtsW [Candidatus Kerfeldbacteria bacterium RIFOXYA2_FULL_38_24]OGY88401.1 MAG: cell division protein FtsW [Candidatus Kerfeldbacteria bacterium RIFOXYB2_FULL_38_14]OGY88941.1 MAG: cell division protein FtsW [Candidatus Kerfeldbacteria bacterium RIFOXYC2_FULL_38_9]